MRPRTTVGLGVVFVAMVVAYAFTNVQAHREVYKAWEAKRLFTFAPEDVTTLSILQQGGEVVEAVRDAKGTWAFVGDNAPVSPNGPLLDQLAAVVAVTTNERPIAESAPDRTLFELEPPKLVVEAGTKGGELVQFNFGGLDPTGRHRYTQLGDGPVFLARAEVYSALDRGLFALRDRRIFTNLADGLTRVDYERLPTETEGTANLDENIRQASAAIQESYEKQASGEWHITVPADARARQDRLRLLETALLQLEGHEYIDEPENLADYGLSTPFARLTVHGKDGEPQTLLLGWMLDDTENPGWYVKRADQRSVAVVDGRLLSIMPSEPMAFREKRLFTGEAKNLKSVRYRDANNEFTLTNDAEKGWTLDGVAANETDQAAVSLYLATLKMIEADAFPEGDVTAQFGEPRVSIAFDFGTTAPATHIEIGGPVPGSDPIRLFARQDFGPVAAISFEKFQAIQSQAFKFRVKNFFSFDPASAEELALSFEGVAYRFVRKDGVWSVAEPAGQRLDRQAGLTVFLDTLAQTTIKGEASPVPASEVQGLDAPLLELTVKLGGAEPRTLGPIKVGNLKAAEARERFVTISGRAGVYYVDQGLVDAVRRCLATVKS